MESEDRGHQGKSWIIGWRTTFARAQIIGVRPTPTLAAFATAEVGDAMLSRDSGPLLHSEPIVYQYANAQSFWTGYINSFCNFEAQSQEQTYDQL